MKQRFLAIPQTPVITLVSLTLPPACESPSTSISITVATAPVKHSHKQPSLAVMFNFL